jgi:hypothetical protein
MTARKRPRRRAAAAAGRRALDPIEQRLRERWSDLAEDIPRLVKGEVLVQARLLAKQHLAMERSLRFQLMGRGKMLKKIATKMRFTIAAINAMERAEPLGLAALGLGNRRSQLERDVSKIDELLPVVRGPSGRARDVQAEFKMKKVAARMCFRLMKRAGVEPEVTIGGTWISFTWILHEIAIGYGGSNAYRACAAVAEEMRAEWSRLE